MSKTISGLLGNRKYINRRQALSIMIGVIALGLVMAGGAGATKFIKIDSKGGDCTSFGTWSTKTKTCTLISGLTETIQINANGITLDGDGYTITGNSTGNGVYLSGRSDVTIKNLNIEQFYNGVSLLYSNNNKLIDNTVSSNYNNGVSLLNSNNNYLIGNTVSNNYVGILLSSSKNNMLTSNNANSQLMGISLYYSNSNMLSGNNADFNSFYGINLIFSDNNTLSGNIADLNTFNGIFLESSNINHLTGNFASFNSGYGIYLSSSSTNNKLSRNEASSNTGNDINDDYLADKHKKHKRWK